MTDVDLMLRFQKGDSEAYEQLVRRNLGFVMRLAMRFIPDTATSEDISQQVFLRIWQSRDQFREQRSFQGWIATITRNLALNEIRTRKRKHWTPRSAISGEDESFQAGQEWLGGTERFTAPTEQLERDEQLDALRDALNELPQREHDAIHLQNVEGWSLEKIAQHMGITVPAAKSLLYRVRKKLAKNLSLKDQYTEPSNEKESGREPS